MNNTKSRNTFCCARVFLFVLIFVEYAGSTKSKSNREIKILFNTEDLVSDRCKTFIANPKPISISSSELSDSESSKSEDSSPQCRRRSRDSRLANKGSRVGHKGEHEEIKESSSSTQCNPQLQSSYVSLDKRILATKKRVENIEVRFKKSSSESKKKEIKEKLLEILKDIERVQSKRMRDLKESKIRIMEDKMFEIENSLFGLEVLANKQRL